MDRISVCMATYNGEKYILQQLESILPQLNDDDEVIISDDHSTDRTCQIITQLKDNRIFVFMNKGKKGPLGNFQYALEQAKGDIIILSDQDDIWISDKVEIIKLMLRSNDLFLSDCQVINEKKETIYSSFFSYRGSRPGFWHNLYKNSYIGCCMAFRREVLLYALPFPKGVHMHDWWIGLLVEIKGKICFYPKPLIQYIRHGENASPTGEKGYDKITQIHNRVCLLWHIARRLTFEVYNLNSKRWFQ